MKIRQNKKGCIIIDGEGQHVKVKSDKSMKIPVFLINVVFDFENTKRKAKNDD